MAYSCSGEIRLPQFSNPNVYYNGKPTGVLGANDTARSMNATAPTVSNFRVSSTTVAPTAPSALNASPSASGATPAFISLSWVDNAGDETGYKLVRSSDGTNWTEIASLGSNATSFTDSGVVAGQSYYYRAYAYNSAGNSAYSNTATAQLAATNTCITANPTISVSPSSISASAGNTVNYNVSVVNNDNSYCSATTITLTAAVPVGWTMAFGNSSLSLAPGSSGSTTLQVQSPATATAGTYPIQLGARGASASLSYVIPALNMLTVSTNQSSYGSGNKILMTAKLMADTAPVPGISISFVITKSNGTAVKVSATTDSTGVASATYNVKKQDPVGLYLLKATAQDPSGATASTSLSVK
jgi:hypothetical protein